MAESVRDEAPALPRRRRSGTVFLAVFAIHLAIALAVGVQAWDDGFITLAFARTFSETGHIALTPLSEQVEGATSPLWFLLMAAVHRMGVTTFEGLHFASQLSAGVCFAAAAVLFHRLIGRTVPGAAWWITVMVFVLGPIRSETGNGMEMSLLCLLIMAIMVLLDAGDGRRRLMVAALVALVPWIRLEATGYLLAGCLAVGVFSAARPSRLLAAIVGGSIASVLTLTLVRYEIFGTVVLTNTMLAKRMPPYSPPFPSPAWWGQQVIGFVVEPVITALPAAVIALILIRMSGQRLRQITARLRGLVRQRRLPILTSFGIGYAGGFALFTAIVGANMFTLPGRMGMSATLTLVIAAVNSVSLPDLGRRVPAVSKLAVAAMFLIPCVGLIAYDSLGIGVRVAQRVSDSRAAKVFAFSAFRANGESMDHVRVLLKRPELTVLIADVGQPGLCCDRLRILDFGLLANSELTRVGWVGFPGYLRAQRPDLIQLHSSFTEESGITRDEFFVNNYVPVFVDISLFYLRQDHFAQLRPRCEFGKALDPYFFTGGEPLTSQIGTPIDSSLRIDGRYLASLGVTAYCRLPGRGAGGVPAGSPAPGG